MHFLVEDIGNGCFAVSGILYSLAHDARVLEHFRIAVGRSQYEDGRLAWWVNVRSRNPRRSDGASGDLRNYDHERIDVATREEADRIFEQSIVRYSRSILVPQATVLGNHRCIPISDGMAIMVVDDIPQDWRVYYRLKAL